MELSDWEAAIDDLRWLACPPPGTVVPPLQVATKIGAAVMMMMALKVQADRDADAQKWVC